MDTTNVMGESRRMETRQQQKQKADRAMPARSPAHSSFVACESNRESPAPPLPLTPYPLPLLLPKRPHLNLSRPSPLATIRKTDLSLQFQF
ncbi:hypothetical protein ACLOJK_005300 [Asimina triloba]